MLLLTPHSVGGAVVAADDIAAAADDIVYDLLLLLISYECGPPVLALVHGVRLSCC
jgi:hypothetical protein